MMELLDIGTWLATATAPAASKFVKKFGKRKYDELVVAYTDAFSDHVKLTEQRCSQIKTLLNRDAPIPLVDQYVNLTFHGEEDETVSDKELVERLASKHAKSLVTGLAGSGKSMFMRWCALTLCNKMSEHQKIPLFIEIREIDKVLFEGDFLDLLFNSSKRKTSKLNPSQFCIGIESGLFIVMLDGLDEAPIEVRDKLLNDINNFCLHYPSCSLVCSSRPEAGMESSSRLTVWHVDRMNLEQAVAVVERSAFDTKKKDAFAANLREGLFEKHEEFLSNPLLCTIMLITFDTVTNIPSRITVFYSQVFEALFFKHDSSKGVYTRERYTNLEIDQFQDVFGTFCFLSYFASEVLFTNVSVIKFSRQALERAKFDVSPQNFVKDCMMSLCIMQEDGQYITFVHRSFQEYFTALFLSNYDGEHFYNLCQRLVSRMMSDNTFTMLCQLDPKKVARRWAIPRCEELSERLGAALRGDGAARAAALSGVFHSLMLNPNDFHIVSYSWQIESDYSAIRACSELSRALGSSRSLAVSGMPFLDEAAEFDGFLVAVDEDSSPEDDDGMIEVRLNKIPGALTDAWKSREMLVRIKKFVDDFLEQMSATLREDDDFVLEIAKTL